MSDPVLSAYAKAWAAARGDFARYLETRSPVDAARFQAALADTLRNTLPIDDGFAKERIVLRNLLRVRQAVATLDAIGPDLAFAQASKAWASEAGMTATIVSDRKRVEDRTEVLEAMKGLNWTWKSRLDRRTCAFCIAMHGRTFPVGARFTSHPNCRCIPVEETLGSGWLWLARQPAKVQDSVLGRMVGLAWRRGELLEQDIIDYGRQRRFPLRNIFGRQVMQAYHRREIRRRARG